MELVNFTYEWPNSQLDPPLVASLCRLVVIQSAAPYVVRHGRKSVASHCWSFYLMQTFYRVTQVTRGGRAQIVGRSLIGRKASQFNRRSVASVSRSRAVVLVLWPEFMLIDLQMAWEGRELASLLWCGRKSLLLLGQSYSFCKLVCQSLPELDGNASLWSEDKSLTTAQESKKSRIFQPVNRS